MSRTELVDAYQRGQIGRRQFIKGMMAIGASLTAATAFADQLRAAPAQSGGRAVQRFVGDPYDDVYDDELGGVTDLPDTGIGAVAAGGTSFFRPLAVAASAAAAGIAMRLRRNKGTPTDSETE